MGYAQVAHARLTFQLRIDKSLFLQQNTRVMKTHSPFFSLPCYALSCLLAAGSLHAAGRLDLHDEAAGTSARSYSLPAGWKGSGSVVRDEHAASPLNRCVQTLQLGKEKEGIAAHYISSWEIPVKKKHPEAKGLADALLPAVCLLPGYSITGLVHSRISFAPKEVQTLRLGRDRLLQSLGKQISGRVYILTATFTAQKGEDFHNVAVGAVVHERTIRTGFRTSSALAFHDIVIVGGPVRTDIKDPGSPAAPELEKAMEELEHIARNGKFDKGWLRKHIRHTAAAFDGMPAIDEKALPALADKAEAGLKLGFPAVVATMRAAYAPAGRIH